MSTQLLHFGISHYNEKVRWALDFKRWPHAREKLVPGFHIPRVRWLTGQNKVPVLLLDGAPIIGSARILDELERRQPDPPLYPPSEADRERALAIQTYFDDEVAPDVRRLFWSAYVAEPDAAARMATDGSPSSTRAIWRGLFPLLLPAFRGNIGLDPPTLERARARLDAHFDRLEREIGASGYLVGSSFGLADLVAASIMSGLVRPPEFPYPLPQPMPAALVALQDAVRDRRGYKWVETMYREHRGVSAEMNTADSLRDVLTCD